MKGYSRLTLEERYQIEVLRRSEIGVRRIGKVLRRNASTICRELRRNSEEKNYVAKRAEREARRRRKAIHPPLKMKGRLKEEVIRRLRKQWSPEQISQTLKRDGDGISHETIYRWVY